MDARTIEYYSQNAATVAARYESIVNGLAAHFESSFMTGGRVLDLGCGSGRDMALLLKMGFESYGLDGTSAFVEIAQKLHPELSGRVVHSQLPDCPVPFAGGFDGVLCSAVLMHLSPADQVAAVELVRRCLKTSGRFLFSVPSQRADAKGEEHRDAHGRLFVPDEGDRLIGICEQVGFVLLRQWSNVDSLGRDGIEWKSVLMERT